MSLLSQGSQLLIGSSRTDRTASVAGHSPYSSQAMAAGIVGSQKLLYPLLLSLYSLVVVCKKMAIEALTNYRSWY